MRAQIRELIRPAMLLAGVLAFVPPSLAGNAPSGFLAHTNQEYEQNAHTNQDGAVPGDAMTATKPAGSFAGVESGAGHRWRPAAAMWVPQSMPVDAGARVPADTVLGLGPQELRGGRLASGEVAAAGGAPRGAIPAPGGLGLLVLAAVAGRRRRRVRASA